MLRNCLFTINITFEANLLNNTVMELSSLLNKQVFIYETHLFSGGVSPSSFLSSSLSSSSSQFPHYNLLSPSLTFFKMKVINKTQKINFISRSMTIFIINFTVINVPNYVVILNIKPLL
jgi:hypothetical protein